MRAWTAGPRPARAVAQRLARQESSPRACRYALGRHARRDPHSTPSWCLPLPERSLAPNAPRGSPHRRAGRSNGSRAAPFSLVLTVGAAPVGGSALRRWCIWRRAPAGCVRRRCRRIGQARCGRRPPRALPTRGPSVADSSLTTPETTRLNRAAPRCHARRHEGGDARVPIASAVGGLGDESVRGPERPRPPNRSTGAAAKRAPCRREAARAGAAGASS
jgi:hypothetical protein